MRHDLRQEPYAVIPPVRICAGGAGKPASLPQPFHDQRRLLPAEAETLIRVVVDWRECARLRACGPDSLFALRVCALNGCAAGSDVQSAWHQALSPRDYESALAIHRWLAQEHVGADR
jgi:hypothetical protein